MSSAPFDGRFKGLAEGRPELLLRLFKLWEPGREALPIHLLRELLPDAVQIDHAYLLGAGTAAARILHFEAITSWHARRIGRLALYRFLIRQKYPSIPVQSFLVLMAEKYVPKEMPERLTYDDGDGLLVSSPYTSIRLWDLDPAMAFEPGPSRCCPGYLCYAVGSPSSSTRAMRLKRWPWASGLLRMIVRPPCNWPATLLCSLSSATIKT